VRQGHDEMIFSREKNDSNLLHYFRGRSKCFQLVAVPNDITCFWNFREYNCPVVPHDCVHAVREYRRKRTHQVTTVAAAEFAALVSSDWYPPLKPQTLLTANQQQSKPSLLSSNIAKPEAANFTARNCPQLNNT